MASLYLSHFIDVVEKAADDVQMMHTSNKEVRCCTVDKVCPFFSFSFFFDPLVSSVEPSAVVK